MVSNSSAPTQTLGLGATPPAPAGPPLSPGLSAPNPSVASVGAPGVPIPNPIPVPKKVKKWGFWEKEVDERNQLEKDGSQSHNIRRVAAYGALLLATLMYCGAFVVLGAALGFIPTDDKLADLDWHILATMLVPLFTVPTVLVIGVLKVTTRSQDEVPKSAQEALGKFVEKIFDKLTE